MPSLNSLYAMNQTWKCAVSWQVTKSICSRRVTTILVSLNWRKVARCKILQFHTFKWWGRFSGLFMPSGQNLRRPHFQFFFFSLALPTNSTSSCWKARPFLRLVDTTNKHLPRSLKVIWWARQVAITKAIFLAGYAVHCECHEMSHASALSLSPSVLLHPGRRWGHALHARG